MLIRLSSVVYYFRILTDCGLAITCSPPPIEVGGVQVLWRNCGRFWLRKHSSSFGKSLRCEEPRVSLSQPVCSVKRRRELGALSVVSDSVGEGGGLLSVVVGGWVFCENQWGTHYVAGARRRNVAVTGKLGCLNANWLALVQDMPRLCQPQHITLTPLLSIFWKSRS